MNKKLGFTLIELLVAATIISVLATIGIVSYQSANQRARNSKRQADMEQMRAALEIYRADNSAYPVGNFDVNLASIPGIDQYLSASSIVDPKNDATYFYWYVGLGPTYTVCALLEPTAASYCLESP